MRSPTMRNFYYVISIIITVVIVVCLSGCANRESTQEEKNKAIARRYIEDLWNKKNLDEIDKLVSDDFVNHSSPPGMTPDREGLKQFISFSGAAFPDGHYTIEDMVAEEDKVMIMVHSEVLIAVSLWVYPVPVKS